MQELDKIMQHPLYIQYYERLDNAEQDRRFCRHQMPHLLDVARIAYILNLERALELKKECIYAAALLHDIGKARQYEEGIPHEIAGREIAEQILDQTAVFSREENVQILQAISEHRRCSEKMSSLGRLLYESDKLSRACYACPKEKDCNWSPQKKNLQIRV